MILFEIPIITFSLISLALIIIPGQDLILVMSRSVAQGSKAGVVTALGVSVGLLGHTILAALGLGVLLQTSEMLFFVMKIAGGIYLIYLGVKTFRSPPIELGATSRVDVSPRAMFFQGALSNLSNPKIAMFYFAFLPQFVSSDAANPTLILLMLGSLFAFLTFVVKAPIGYLAGTLSLWLRARPGVQIWLNRISGTVLIGLGLRLAYR
ncbi:MAG: LysE family translocator [Gammaproteobacteria bacterium]|nr:LysE family translocator [Gammaproteobacteria bacterium]